MTSVRIYPDAAGLAGAVAERVVAAASDAVRERGCFSWCLSGGHTPRPAYELLATAAFVRRVPWDRTDVFFADERCVPPDDAVSNYRLARDALLGRVLPSGEHVHRIAGERDPAEAAAAYEALLRGFLGVDDAGAPRRGFDLLLLGLGRDGHTASLFPGSVDEPDRWVSARRAAVGSAWRVTLTPRVCAAARVACFVVGGAEKAERLAEVLAGPERPAALPAQRIRPAGGLVWLVDRDAAAVLLSGDGAVLRERGVRLEVQR